MVPDMSEDATPDGSGSDPGGEWLTVAAAARRLGISPRAIRGRIRRGTIEWRTKGNTGREVLVTGEDATPNVDRDGPPDGLDQLRAEVDQLQEELIEARVRVAAARAEKFAAEAIAKAQVEARDQIIQELRDQLAYARRRWWHVFKP